MEYKNIGWRIYDKGASSMSVSLAISAGSDAFTFKHMHRKDLYLFSLITVSADFLWGIKCIEIWFTLILFSGFKFEIIIFWLKQENLLSSVILFKYCSDPKSIKHSFFKKSLRFNLYQTFQLRYHLFYKKQDEMTFPHICTLRAVANLYPFFIALLSAGYFSCFHKNVIEHPSDSANTFLLYVLLKEV